MRTTDLFKFNRSSKRINESLEKTFGTKINFEDFDTAKLEDARNKLRTQIHTARTEAEFNENIENDTLTKAQWMHDAIVSELMDRQEHIVDTTVEEGHAEYQAMFDDWMNSEDAPYKDMAGDYNAVMQKAAEYLAGRVPDHEISDIAEKLTAIYHGEDDEGGRHELPMPNGDREESVETEDESARMSMAQELYKSNPDLDSEDDILNAGFAIMKQRDGAKAARYYFSYDEDFPSDFISEYKWLQRQEHDVGEATGRDAYQRDYDSSVSGMGGGSGPKGYDSDGNPQGGGYDEYPNEPRKPYQAPSDKPKLLGYYFYDVKPGQEDQAAAYDVKKLKSGKWAMAKYSTSGRSYGLRRDSADKAFGPGKWWAPKNESINTGDNMSNLREGEIQQASAIVTAKTMVDRVGRWIEELSGMENETLLQLGDSIRDEMGQEQARAFIEAVAPAIQAALDNLKQTRDTLSTGVRSLASGEQPTDMLGGEPGADMGGEPGADMATPAEPDAMNAEPAADDFGAADAAVGGMEAAGREQRESIDRQSRLMKILAG